MRWLRAAAAIAAVMAVWLGYEVAVQLAWERAGGVAPATSATPYLASAARPQRRSAITKPKFTDPPAAPAAKIADVAPATADQTPAPNGLAWSNPAAPLTSSDLVPGTQAHAPFFQAALQNAGAGLPGAMPGSRDAGFGGGSSMGGVGGGGGGGSSSGAASDSASGSDELLGAFGRRPAGEEIVGSEVPTNPQGPNGGAPHGNGSGGPGSNGNAGPSGNGPGANGPSAGGPSAGGPSSGGAPGDSTPGGDGPAGDAPAGPGDVNPAGNPGGDRLGGPTGGPVPPETTGNTGPASVDDENEPHAIPEPGSVLLALGAVAALARRRRR